MSASAVSSMFHQAGLSLMNTKKAQGGLKVDYFELAGIFRNWLNKQQKNVNLEVESVSIGFIDFIHTCHTTSRS